MQLVLHMKFKQNPKYSIAYHLHGDLRLEEFDVFCKVERVLPTVADHVCIQDMIGCLEDSCQMGLVNGALQLTLQQPYQQVNHLERDRG